MTLFRGEARNSNYQSPLIGDENCVLFKCVILEALKVFNLP